MRVAILVLLLPALVLAYPYPQRSSEGVSRTSRGKQRFNIEELPASATDVEPTVSLSRRGSSQRRSGYESQREPETASSVVAPVTQQLLSSRTTSQRRGTLSATQATDDKFRSRSSFNRRTPGSQDSVDRGFSSRRRESFTETTPVPYKSPQVEQSTLESNKENYPTPSVEIVRNPPPSETPALVASSTSLPQPSNPTGFNRRRTSTNRNSDTTVTEFSSRNAFPASDTSNERQARFESSRRRQSSDIGQDTSASEGRRNGRRNLSRGTARGNSADFNTNSVTSSQDFPNKSRNSGRRESTSVRRGENNISSPSVSFPSRSRSSSTQSRPSKENENINNDIPIQEIPDDPSLIASKRMDTIGDTSEEPVTPELSENISSEPESSSVQTEENLASSSELPSTPDYSENTPKPLDILQSNRRKSSATRSQSNSRESVPNDRNPKSRSQTTTQKAGLTTNSRRGSARTSRVNDNSADYSTNSNVGYEEAAFNVNAVNYRRDSSVISSNTEQFSQRSVVNSRRNQQNTRGRTEESEASTSRPSPRGSLRRNSESPKSINDINANAGTPTASLPSSRVNNRRNSSSDTNRRLTGSERRGSRGYNADNSEPYVEEASIRRGSRTRSNTTTRTELNSVDSVKPIARSGRRTSEPDVIATATTAQRTSRRTSPDVGQRGSVKDSSTTRNSPKPKKIVTEDEDIDESENYPAVFLKALKALKSEKTEKSVPESEGNEKVANSLEIRKRGNKVSEKQADAPIVPKEKTRKISLLLAPSPPSENVEQDSRHQSNDILLPRDQDKSKDIQQTIFKTNDETTESIISSRNSGRRPSKSDTTYEGSTTGTKTRTALKSTRPQNRIRQIDAAVSKAPEALHQIISPTAIPAHRSTSKFGSNIHPDLDLSSAKAFEVSSSVSPISHEYPLTTESYLSDNLSGERIPEDTNSNGDLPTSTKKSGFFPRARPLYKTSTALPAPETSSKTSYSSRTRSSTPRPSLPKATSGSKRRISSTTAANVVETTPQSAFIQSPIAPPSPHRFSARYRNDLLRVTGALRVTTTPAYVPTVPTVSTTTSTTSTTDSLYVENSSEALTVDASSLTLDASSLTLTDVDSDISLDSLEVAHSLKELNEIYPSSTEIDLQTLPNVLQNIDPPTSSSTVRTTSSTSSSLPEKEQSTIATTKKPKIVTETTSELITAPTSSVTTSTIAPPATGITEPKVTTLPTVAVDTETTKIITPPLETTSEAHSTTTTLKTTTSLTSTTTLKPTTSTALNINTTTTEKSSNTTQIPKIITASLETTSEAHRMTTTLKTTASITSTTTLKPTTSTTLKMNTVATAKPTTTPKTTVASTVPNEASTVNSSNISSTTMPTTVTTKTTEHTTTRHLPSITTTLVPGPSTFATVPARNNTSFSDSDSEENSVISRVGEKETSDLTLELDTTARKKSVSTAKPPPLLPPSTTTVPSGRFPARLTVAPRGTVLSTTTILPPPQFEDGMNLEVFSSGEPSIYNPPPPVRFIYTQPPSTTRRTPAPYVIFGIFPNNTIFRKFPDSDIKEIVSENEISRPQSYYPDEHHTSSEANNFYTSTQQPQKFANVNNFHGTNQQEFSKQDVQNTALYSLHHTAENEVLRTNAATFAAGSSDPNVPAQISVGTSQPVLTETPTISNSTRPFSESAQEMKQVPPVIVQTPIEFSNSVYNGQDNKYKNFWSSTSTRKPEFRILTTDIPVTTPASVSSTSVFIVTPEPPTTTSTTTEVFRWKPTSAPSTIGVQKGTADVTTTTEPTFGLRGLISRVLVQNVTADVTTAKNTASTPLISVTTAAPSTSVTPTVKVATNAVTRASTTTTTTTTTTASSTTTTKKATTKVETTTQPTLGLRGFISRVLGNIPTSQITSSTSEATPVTTASVSTAKPTTIAPQPTPTSNAATTSKRDIGTLSNPGAGISTTVKPVVTTIQSTTSKPPSTSIKPSSTSLKPLTSTTTTTTTKPTHTTTVKPAPSPTTTKTPTTSTTTTKKPTTPPTTTKKPTTPPTTTKKPTTPTKKPVTTTKKPVVTTTTKRPISTATTSTTTKKPASTTTTKKPVPNTTTKIPTTTITTTTKKLPTTTSTTTKRPTTTITTTTTTTTRKTPTTVTTTTKRPSTTTSPKPPTTSITSPSLVSTTTARSTTPITTTVIPAATSPKTASTLSKGFPANSFGDFAFLNSLLGGQQENKKRPGRERTGDLANKVIEIAIQRASTSTTTSHPTLTTKDSQLNFPGIMEQEEYEDKPRTSRDKDNNMANKVIEVAVQRASTSTAAPVAPPSSDETNTSPRKLSPDEQLLAALLNSQSRGPSTTPPQPKNTSPRKLSPDEQLLAALLNSQSKGPSTTPPHPKATVASKLSPDEQFLAALLESQLKAAITTKPKTQTPAPKQLSPDEQFLAALLKSQLGGSSTSKPKPQGTSTKLTDDQLLAALLGSAQAGGPSPSKTQTRPTASASAAPAAAQSPALLGGLLGQLGGRNTLPDPATVGLTDEDDVDPPRGQRLVKAAIDVTKAVSQFMNVVIQGASERFQTFFRSGTSLLSNYFSWGSSQAGNFS